MTNSKKERTGNALKVFKKQKILKLDQLMGLLKYSRCTVQQRLKEWGTYTSYNQNGRYYTHLDIPQFNEYGIWKYKNVLFSKHGNLKKTFVYIVGNSTAGLSAINISEVLELPAYTFLGHYKDVPDIYREKHKGIYIYFSDKRNIFEKQKREREKIVCSAAELDLPSDGQAVIILVELIKHSYDSIDKLVRQVKRKGVGISVDKVQNLLIYHDLQKKTLVSTD